MTTDLDDPAPANVAGAGSSARWGLRSFLLALGVGLLLTLALRAFVVESFYVPSSAMDPAVPAGSRVLVIKPAVHPEAGDVVVADITTVFGLGERATPMADGLIGRALSAMASAVGVQSESQTIVSRVVAVGGDMVSVSAGTVTVNGIPVRTGVADADLAEFAVPNGQVWLLGDDHARAIDSLTVAATAPNAGAVPVDAVVGRAGLTFWPLSRFGVIATEGEAGQ